MIYSYKVELFDSLTSWDSWNAVVHLSSDVLRTVNVGRLKYLQLILIVEKTNNNHQLVLWSVAFARLAPATVLHSLLAALAS